MELRNLVEPTSSVVVTMEVQEGIIGESSAFQDLHNAAVSSGVLSNGPDLCTAARQRGVPVIHAMAINRNDYRGSVANCRMLSASKDMHERGSGIIEGTKGAELVDVFGPEPEDISIARLHGLTPFTSTSLDQTIRNLGASTIIPIGVSINIGILGLVLSAVDLGYQVVIPTDAVAGVPPEYGEKVLQGTLSLLSTLTTTQEIISTWK